MDNGFLGLGLLRFWHIVFVGGAFLFIGFFVAALLAAAGRTSRDTERMSGAK